MKITTTTVNDSQFTYEILLSKGLGTLTRKAEMFIYVLVQNAIRKTQHKFFNEDDKNDSIQASYEKILNKWQGFNPEKSTSAFVYISEIHKRAVAEFLNYFHDKKGIKKEDNKKLKFISMNSSNNGQGLYNI